MDVQDAPPVYKGAQLRGPAEGRGPVVGFQPVSQGLYDPEAEGEGPHATQQPEPTTVDVTGVEAALAFVRPSPLPQLPSVSMSGRRSKPTLLCHQYNTKNL